MRLLLVEDERRLADALVYILKKISYGVDVAYDGENGQALAETGIYEVIILDRLLPRKDGLTVLRELRTQGNKTPVLILTARGAIADRVAGLDAGADDYLVKPFATDEFLARVRALARRQDKDLLAENLSFCDLTLDPLRCEVLIGSERIKLTLKESLLLELFMRNPGQVLTREQILDKVWGLDSPADAGSVEIYIHYLRRKLTLQTCHIQTVRGIGYCLEEMGHV
ncbi:MAG: response regulator transcription factor [Desulfitobacteriaceae bacterium]